MSITVLLPENLYSAPLRALLEPLLPPGSVIRRPEDGMEDLQNRRLLFAVALDPSGCNLAYYGMLQALRGCDTLLRGSVAGVIVTGVGEFYTKDVARDMVFAANQAGCAFLGRPLVEATGSLRNFRTQAQIGGVDEKTAFRLAVGELVDRLTAWRPLPPVRRVLALHASQRSASNTLALWGLVRTRLEERCDITEICLRNGTLEDCAGCPYTTCLHFGEQGGCFYGGVMVQEVYPAIREADALVLLCPNYNDALSANLTAAINRLTALYRTTSFADKAVFAIVVSGYSGGDIVACQAAGAMNMNKGFWLPANFCLLETANDKGEALALPGIQDRADRFAENMLCQLAY